MKAFVLYHGLLSKVITVVFCVCVQVIEVFSKCGVIKEVSRCP